MNLLILANFLCLTLAINFSSLNDFHLEAQDYRTSDLLKDLTSEELAILDDLNLLQTNNNETTLTDEAKEVAE